MDTGDRKPAVQLTVREQLVFMRIVHHETHGRARRLLDIWARPEDLGEHAERMLKETFRLLWRTTD